MRPPASEPKINPRRDALVIAAVIFASACLPLFFLWERARGALLGEVRAALQETAEAYALLVDGDVHQTLRYPDQESTPAYQEVVERFRRFMAKNPRLSYVYTVILDDEGRVRFVLDSALPGDADGDGVDDHSYLMDVYESPSDTLLAALREMKSVVAPAPHTDQWGTFISGFAPVYNGAGEPVAILGVDIDVRDMINSLSLIRRSALAGLVLAFAIALLAAVVVGRARFHTLQARDRARMAEARKQQVEETSKDILLLINQGASLEMILHALIESIEKLLPGALCSVLFLDDAKQRFIGSIAPHLPPAYNQSLIGLEVGPCVGSCGTAAYTKQRVIIADILEHPYWREAKALAAPYGLRACWSQPILAKSRDILGTFAVYFKEVRSAEEQDLAVLDRAGYLAGIAMERVAYERDLAGERNLLRSLIDNIPDVVFAKDRQFRYIAANHAAVRFLGVASIAELMGQTDEAFQPAASAAATRQMENQVIEGARPVEQESTVIHPDGRTQHFAFHRMPLVDPGGNVVGLITVGRDVTDRRHVEEERIKTQKLESLGVLAGGIAHDFNNILTTILGNISMITSTGDDGRSERGELIREAERAVARARELTQQLLTFAKGGQPVKKPTDVAAVIRESASLAARGSSSRLTLDLHPDLWIADIDSGQIGQAIQNLVLNAEQAMPSGGDVSIAAWNLHLPESNRHELPPGPYICISVKDTGPGVAPELFTRIFDPYFTTKPDGNGLGLTSTFSIIKKHGGIIWVESAKDQGAVFTFLLPALPEGVPLPAPVRLSASERQSARILVMDDEVSILKISSKMLQHAGYQVVTATNGSEALAEYRAAMDANTPFDLVVLDLTIPGGMGGKETFEHLQKLDPNVNALVSSGYSMDDIMSRHEFFGFRGVITKPFHRDELLAAIAAALVDSRRGL
ncbi:MAG TPA: PAS domain-containing protein [Kiritimatiellia bacterium]|nr:PAS domain-containing protein [Kiritimatiellia bacterium]HMO97555.1 PAS domain-containing protein [Kiritimatiellia bacterium]HMP95959.1 PAS domain-containing protein [Kiritimatiellia bacterium]